MKSKTKISLLLIFLVVLITPVILSYSKYTNTSDISLKSRTVKISKTWKVEKYNINNNDYTYLVSCYTETFSENGYYSYSWGNLIGSGIWTFQNNYKEVNMTGNENLLPRTLVILKLNERSFWYYYMDGINKNELHMVAN